MKVLVATSEKQGQRSHDFHWCNEGELVMFGSGGCKRSLSGFETHKASTTFKVVEVDETDGSIREKITASLRDAGWIGHGGNDKDMIQSVFRNWNDLRSFAEFLDVGTIVERRGNILQVRE